MSIELEDLIIEFDEMGYEPTTLCENPQREVENFKRRLKEVLVQAEQDKKKARAWDVLIKKRVWLGKLRKLLLKHRDKSSQQQLEFYNSRVSCHIKLEDLELFKELFK